MNEPTENQGPSADRSERDGPAGQETLEPVREIAVLRQRVGRIGHDFGNLLQAIIGHAEMLAEDAANPAQTRAVLEDMITAACKGADLSRELLSIGHQAE